MAIWRVRTAEGERLARGSVEAGPTELLAADATLDALLSAGSLDAPGDGPVPVGLDRARPGPGAGGVGGGRDLLISRSARNEESGGHDFYDRVYDAERPELFFKAAPGRVRGPGGQIGVRADSGWDVPEPELALVVNAAGEIVAYTIGNDVSSRSIEGENPLYLPQAKTYRGSCALGPCLVPVARRPTRARWRSAHDQPRRRPGLRGLDSGRAARSAARPSSSSGCSAPRSSRSASSC